MAEIIIQQDRASGDNSGWGYYMFGCGVYAYASARLFDGHFVLSELDPITINAHPFGVVERENWAVADERLRAKMREQVQKVRSAYLSRHLDDSSLKFNDLSKVILEISPSLS